MLPRSLFGKLLLLFLAFGALMTGIFVFVMRVSHETYHLEFDQLVNRELAQQYVRANLLVRDPPLTAHNFARSLDAITSVNPGIDVYVLDARGEVLAASATGGHVVRARVNVEPIVRFIDGHTALPIRGDDPTTAAGSDVFSAAPLSIPDCPAAYLYVVLGRSHVSSAAGRLKQTYAIGEGVGITFAAALLAMGGSILFLRVLTRRLGLLQSDLTRFRDSQFIALPPRAAEPGRPSDDEVERLRHMFVELAEHIRAQMQELQTTDEMRRDFLANISHDLRTPLTTLQAHLETLSVKEDLSPEERRGYLATTLQQCRRLIVLVEQLLELAKLEARRATVTIEPFQIAELAHDVALKFAPVAQRMGVALHVEPPGPVIPLVRGDIALIERVLDNLIDNALRFASLDGTVTVRVAAGPLAVRVEVQDSGPGIPESERAHVFDRFYRSDRNRSSNSGHAGLGLAIVRSILALHGTSIDFTSVSGQGTTFHFELPIAPVPVRGNVST